MNEKRFDICIDLNDRKSLWDSERIEEEPLIALRFDEIWGIDDCCRLLNELHEENKELKLQYSNLEAQRNEFFRGAMENASRVKQLKEEVDYWKKRALLLENKYGEGLTQKRNMFTVVNGIRMQFLGETKTNYLLPIESMKALCIMFNYLYWHGKLPPVLDIHCWWEKKEFQEYYDEEEENDRE